MIALGMTDRKSTYIEEKIVIPIQVVISSLIQRNHCNDHPSNSFVLTFIKISQELLHHFINVLLICSKLTGSRNYPGLPYSRNIKKLQYSIILEPLPGQGFVYFWNGFGND